MKTRDQIRICGKRLPPNTITNATSSRASRNQQWNAERPTRHLLVAARLRETFGQQRDVPRADLKFKGRKCSARFVHVIPILDNIVLNGILQFQLVSPLSRASRQVWWPIFSTSSLFRTMLWWSENMERGVGLIAISSPTQQGARD